MTREEKLKSKTLYKIELCLIKFIPGLLAGTCLLNTVLSYFGINVPLLSYIGGVSFFMICFLYLSSVVFRFCIYHRLFIHYVALNWALNIYDWYIGIPCSDRSVFVLYMSITGLLVFFVVFSYLRERKHGSKEVHIKDVA